VLKSSGVLVHSGFNRAWRIPVEVRRVGGGFPRQ
jgi:hypothetical protein